MEKRMLQVFFLLLSGIVFLILMALRHGKARGPLLSYGDRPLPGFPGPIGLIRRLDGMGRKQREILPGHQPTHKKDGMMTLPLAWEDRVTAGRMACTAHAWALSIMAEDDPVGDKNRTQAVYRSLIVPFFVVLIALALVFVKHADVMTMVSLSVFVWAFLAFAAVPSQMREKKAVDVAKTGLREAGMWPQLSEDAYALETCLNAMAWSRVAGFPRILPR